MTSMRDDLLERALREADPAPTPRDARPDAAALRMRDRIIRSATRAPRRRARTLGWASALGAAVAATAIAVAVMVPQTEAVAGGPEPLEFSEADSVDQTLNDARDALTSASGPAEPIRIVRTATWALDINGSTGETTVVPQLTTLEWAPDGSGKSTSVHGVPYDPEDAAANVGAEISSSGEVSYEIEFEPGQFTSPAAEGFGDSRDAVFSALEAYWMPADPDAADIVQAMTTMLGEWTLTNAQESQLLGILGESDGVQSLGTTEDRLGRPVAGLRVVSADGAVSDVVLLSLETGRIVGVERTNLVENDLVRAGAIMSYTLWDVDGALVR